jgi:hypothetical protein
MSKRLFPKLVIAILILLNWWVWFGCKNDETSHNRLTMEQRDSIHRAQGIEVLLATKYGVPQTSVNAIVTSDVWPLDSMISVTSVHLHLPSSTVAAILFDYVLYCNVEEALAGVDELNDKKPGYDSRDRE